MAISDHPDIQARKSVARRAVGAKSCSWSDGQKLEAVTTYLMIGNLAATARILKIPEETMRHWRRSTWWVDIESELKTQDELQLSARLKKIVDKSIDAVEDRLEHGDFVYDQKTGQMRRKPVAMRDAHKVSMDLIDKRNLLLNNNKTVQTDEQMSDKLLKMMQQFAEFAQGKLDKNNIVEDVEIKEVPNEDDNAE